MAKSKNRISPANIVAVIAVAALGVITFFGALFQSEDGTIGSAAIKAAVFTFAIGLLLVLCIVTKQVESEFKKWRVIEYICLAAYIAVAVIFYKPFLQFFHVVQNKEKLQTQALHEITSIDSLCDTYNSKAETELSRAAQNMKSYSISGQEMTDEDGGLADYINRHSITNFNRWSEDNMENVDFEKESLDSLRQRVEMWSYMDLSAIAYEMTNKAADTWDNLEDHISYIESEFELIPVISHEDADHPYRLEGYVEFNIGDDRPEPSKFSKMFREPVNGFNIGIVIYIVLHLLALLNYFLVRRSPVIDIKKNNSTDDMGLPLQI